MEENEDGTDQNGVGDEDRIEDAGDVIVVVVRGNHHQRIRLGVMARKCQPHLRKIIDFFRKIIANDGWRIATPLYVDQKGRICFSLILYSS